MLTLLPIDTGFAANAVKQTCPRILQTVALSTDTSSVPTAPGTKHALLVEVAGLGYARHELHGFRLCATSHGIGQYLKRRPWRMPSRQNR